MTANPRRDAWSAIRGFYYQIQLTVQRWLELSAADELFCERGEDIEIIRAALGGSPTPEQVLEQIKIREAVSLRSVEVVTALIRYFEARKAGARPTLFRFITTARPAKEQGAAFPRQLEGLSAWNAARNRELSAGEINAVAKEAKRLVRNAPKPADVSEELASEFFQSLDALTAEEFTEEYIARIEWALNAEGSDSLRSDLTAALVSSKRVSSDAEALMCVDLLVAHVFRLLTQRGPKRLVEADIDIVLKQNVLSSHEQRVLTLLDAFAAQTSAQLSALETKTDEILGLVATTIQDKVADVLLKVDGLTAQQVVSAPTMVDAPPAIDEWISARPALVTQIGAALAQNHAYVLLGPTGMGKTTLAAQVCRSWPTSSRRHWISLTQRVRAEARGHLLRQLLIHGGAKAIVPMTFGDVAREYARVLGPGLLVLDDVGNTNADTLLAEQIYELISAIVTADGHVLITGHSPLPASAPRASRSPEQLSVPGLTTNEVREVLTLARVHEVFLGSRAVELIHATTSGHPILVAATVRYIQSHEGSDPDALMAVVTGEPVRPVRIETRKRLRELLADDARGIVDRLSILWNRFDKNLAFALAAVEPGIRNPGEIIEDLRGVWLHTVTVDQLELSPLLKGIGSEFLDTRLQQRLHATVARTYMTSRTITPTRAIEIAFHLIGGRQWRMLTGFLFQIAQHVHSPKEAEPFDVLPMMFRPSFPANLSVPLGTRIAFRAVQTRLATLTKGKVGVLLGQMRALSDSVTDDAGMTEAFLGWLLLGPLNSGAPASLSLEATMRAVRLAPRIPSVLTLDIPAPLEALIWASIPSINSAEDVDAFVATIASMTDMELRNAFMDERLRTGIEIAAGKCASVELALPEAERDWFRAVARLDRLEARGRSAGIQAIVDAAEREKATVLSDFMGQPERALEILTANRERRSSAERMRRDHLAGAVLLDNVSSEAALERYEQALLGPASEDPLTYGDAARRAAEAAAKLGDWPRAARFATRAVVPLRDAGLKYDSLDIITELAWLHWQWGNHGKAVAAMAGVVRSLATTPEAESPRYRESFRKAGMLLGWMSTLSTARSEQPWAGEPFATPFPGWASRSRPLLATLSTPMSIPFLKYVLARATAKAGVRGSALDQFRQAANSATAEGLSVIECMATSGAGEMCAGVGDVEGAICATLRGLRIFALDRNSEDSGLMSQVSIEDAWVRTPVARRRDIQGMLFWEAIGPLMTQGVARGLDDEAFRVLFLQMRDVLRRRPDIEDTERWLRLVDLAFDAVTGPMSAHDIRELIKSHSDDTPTLVTLYLSLMRSPGASLEEVCGSQVLCLTTFRTYQTWVSSAMDDLARYVFAFWHRASNERRFALVGPTVFKKAIEGVLTPTVPNAARILLAALAATRTSVASELRVSLSQIAER